MSDLLKKIVFFEISDAVNFRNIFFHATPHEK